METIIYQGQSIQAQKVNHMSGSLSIAALPEYDINHEGDEELFRDSRGQYYLRRKLLIWDVDGTFEHRASGRTHVHRITLAAAVQWATTRANVFTHDLRRDVTAALAAPTSTSNTRQFTDGSMALTLHLQPGVARLVRAAAELNARTPLAEVYDSLRIGTIGRLAQAQNDEQQMDHAFREAAPFEGPVRLRDFLLRVVTTDGVIHQEADLDNGLAADIRSRTEDLGGSWGRAVIDLLQRGRDAINCADITVELDSRAIALLSRYELPPGIETWDVVNGATVSMLSSALDDVWSPLEVAEQEAMRLRKFGIGEVDEKDDDKEAGQRAATSSLELSGTQFRMLRQAARCDGRTPEEWALSVLGDNVALTLKDFYGHDEERALVGWNGEQDEVSQAAPNPPGRPIQLIRAEDGALWDEIEVGPELHRGIEAYSKEAGLEFGDGLRQLVRHGLHELGRTNIPVTMGQPEPGMTVHLDPEAAALVRQYHGVSPFFYTADDIASGCVGYLLEIAFGNQEEAEKMTGLDTPGFHDGEWGTAKRAFHDAQNRRHEREAEAGESTPEDAPVSFQGRRHTHNPADVALLAAAKPEAAQEDDEEPLPEEEHTDDDDEEDDNAGEEWKEGK